MRRSDCHSTRATWGARCGKTTRRVLRGGTSTSERVARPVPTHHTIPHELLLKTLRTHTDCRWVMLYVERWLKAPVQREDGCIEPRDAGTPQGSVVSPILANLFLHYTFDLWMTRTHPAVPFERYADDAICHCRSESEAEALRVALAERFAACGLVLHPQKNENRLLRGYQPQGTLSHSPVRLPRLYIPTEVYGLAQRNIWRLVLARGVSRSTQGNASGSPAMGSPEPDRHCP
jgi:hypothetical protein